MQSVRTSEKHPVPLSLQQQPNAQPETLSAEPVSPSIERHLETRSERPSDNVDQAICIKVETELVSESKQEPECKSETAASCKSETADSYGSESTHKTEEAQGSPTDIESDGAEDTEKQYYPHYKCYTCKAHFRTKCHFFRDQLSHKYYCTKCKLSYVSARSLKSHTCPVCPTCKRRFPNSARLNRHLKKCTLRACHIGRLDHEDTCIRCLTCVVCKTEFTSDRSLREHLLQMRYNCADCCKCFSSPKELAIHECELCVCRACGQQFEDIIDLASHLRTHAAPRSYSRTKRGLTGEVGKITGTRENETETPKMFKIGKNEDIDANTQELSIEVVKTEPEEIIDSHEQEGRFHQGGVFKNIQRPVASFMGRTLKAPGTSRRLVTLDTPMVDPEDGEVRVKNEPGVNMERNYSVGKKRGLETLNVTLKEELVETPEVKQELEDID